METNRDTDFFEFIKDEPKAKPREKDEPETKIGNRKFKVLKNRLTAEQLERSKDSIYLSTHKHSLNPRTGLCAICKSKIHKAKVFEL